MNFEIPPGLTDLLQEFTVAVLRARPSNLELFAATYFNNLNEKKNGPLKNTNIRFQNDDDTVRIEPTSFDDSQNDDDEEEEVIGKYPKKLFSKNMKRCGCSSSYFCERFPHRVSK